MILDILVRIGGGLLGGYAAYAVAYLLAEGIDPGRRNIIGWAAAAVVGAVAVWFTGYVTARPLAALRRTLGSMPLQDLVVATGGLFVGLVLSALAAIPLSLLPDLLGRFLPLVTCLAFAYAGVTVALMRRRELLGLAPRGLRLAERGSTERGRILLDTSAIIDGRVADVYAAGFIRDCLLVPRFVLEELQRIADSADAIRRNRGRRGLDVLERLQRRAGALEIVDLEAEGADVDAKLVSLAAREGFSILTTDFNLNRVARLQGVRVLNMNDLANAVKTIALPGEALSVRIVQDGKEWGQGVGFLDDGTMVVVDGGRRYKDLELEVVVTRALQTSAGRMLFAQPKGDGAGLAGRVAE